MQTFKTLLDMGRLVRIADWARSLAKKDPYKKMASHVRELAETADVPALNQLLGVLSNMANPVSMDKKTGIVTIQE